MPIADPVIILAPMRSYTTVVCSMLGQHPQLQDVLELHLFLLESMEEWWVIFGGGRTLPGQGLLRTIAQVYFGKQNEATIELARGWLYRRLHWSTADVFKALAQRVYPLILVEKTPETATRIEYLERARRTFPKARFIHLLRHPLGQGRSVMKVMELMGSFTERFVRRYTDFNSEPANFDPQVYWLRYNQNIKTFLATVPGQQQMRVRGEDLLADPDQYLHDIAKWLGIRSDKNAIEAMKHPERSLSASMGPRNARGGGDWKFMAEPKLRPPETDTLSLEGSLPWRADGQEFSPEVRELALEFGYSPHPRAA